MNIDLHIHSSYSDGAYSPYELIMLAKQLDVGVLAIADHDSVAGVSAGIAAGHIVGIEVIPATELSVQFENFKDVHLLGYGINYGDDLFLQHLSGFRNRRERRNEEILQQVNKLLLTEERSEISCDEVCAYANGSIGRPHIARVLLDRRYVTNVEDAFRRYLIPCDVPKSYWPMDEAINEIHRIGGVAVLAHPTSISKDPEELRQIILKLEDIGLDGLEAFNNMGWPQEMEFLRRLATELDLLVTAGSDFHGIEDGLVIGKGREGIRFDGNLLAPLYNSIHQSRQNRFKLF
jgi:predicted metal-dependent phosphoesterase TrpH